MTVSKCPGGVCVTERCVTVSKRPGGVCVTERCVTVSKCPGGVCVTDLELLKWVRRAREVIRYVIIILPDLNEIKALLTCIGNL